MALNRPALIAAGLVVLVGLAALTARHEALTNAPAGQAGASPVTPLYMPGTPAGLLATYLDGDFHGERLERALWLTKYRAYGIWPNEPAWSSAYVIARYRLQSNAMTVRDADVEATFDTLGELDLQTFVYQHSPSRQTVPYKLLNGPKGWQIAFPMLKPHVGPQAAIAYLQRMAVGYPHQRGAIAASIAAIEAEAGASAAP